MKQIDVTEHRGLIKLVIDRHRYAAPRIRGSLQREDLVQAGYMGFLRAAKTFDPAKGSWSTYACQWIRSAIGKLICDHASDVRIPSNLQHARRKRGERMRALIAHLDAPLRSDGESTLLDLLPAPEAESTDVEQKEAKARLAPLLRAASLSERERDVLTRRFIRDQTLSTIANHFGLSRERVRQIEADALDSLQRASRRLERFGAPPQSSAA